MSVGRAPILLPLIGRAPWLLPLSLCEHRPGKEPASPIHLQAPAKHQEAPPVVLIVGRAPIPPELNPRVGHAPLGPPRLLVIYYEATPVRWSPGAILFTQKIALLSEQTHETNRIVRGKLHVPPPNDESQTLLGAPVGPVHVTKVCGKAPSYLFCLMRRSCLLLRRAGVVLKKSMRGGHSTEVRDTTRMPLEGYVVIFARQGGGARHRFRCLNYCLIPASSQTCHGAHAHPNPE